MLSGWVFLKHLPYYSIINDGGGGRGGLSFLTDRLMSAPGMLCLKMAAERLIPSQSQSDK